MHCRGRVVPASEQDNVRRHRLHSIDAMTATIDAVGQKAERPSRFRLGRLMRVQP